MEDLKLKLEELKKYIGKIDDDSRTQFDIIMKEIEAMQLTEKERATVGEFLLHGINDIKGSIDKIENELKIRDQLKEVAGILPLSYIAKNYFGKSAAWLYQRINGNKVRGKVYTLNHEEVATFNRALKEIGNKISSLSITC